MNEWIHELINDNDCNNLYDEWIDNKKQVNE